MTGCAASTLPGYRYARAALGPRLKPTPPHVRGETLLSNSRIRLIAAIGLVAGALLGMAGTFASSAAVRGLAWGLDGTLLVVAAALLTVHYYRNANDAAAAGFLVFVVGQGLIVSSAAMDPVESTPSFAAGLSLWAASLVLVGVSGAMPRVVNITGFVASLLFALVAAQMFLGYPLTPLSQPLPFFAYPFLVATLIGWAWSITTADQKR